MELGGSKCHGHKQHSGSTSHRCPLGLPLEMSKRSLVAQGPAPFLGCVRGTQTSWMFFFSGFLGSLFAVFEDSQRKMSHPLHSQL